MYGLLKTIISPIFLITLFFAAGTTFLFLNQKKALVKWLLGIAFTLLFLLSFRPFSNLLLWGLECQYPALMNFDKVHHINNIVLLTAWSTSDSSIPYTSKLDDRSIARVLEAHRIYVELPSSRIIISGSEIGTQIMAKFLVLWGVPKEQIIIDRAKNTWETAKNVKKLISEQPFILVTSATHLPRTMYSFIKQGLRPVPAPCDFFYGYTKFKVPFIRPFSYYLPNITSFWKSHLALHEYTGMFWYYITDISRG